MDTFRLIPVSRTELVIPRAARGDAIREIVIWMAKRAATQLPKEALAGDDFDTGLDVAAPALAFNGSYQGNSYWAGRLRFDDIEQASRSWHAEIVLSDTEPDSRIVVRLDLLDSDEGLAAAPFSRSVPGLVQQICVSIACNDGANRLTDRPILVDDIDSFEALVFDGQRQRPALIFGGARPEAKLSAQRRLDIEWLAQRLSGVAHVGILGSEASRDITHRYGKAFSVFGSAAKLYLPDIDQDVLKPFDHPLYYLSRNTPQDLLAQLIWHGLSQRQIDPLPSFDEIARSRRADTSSGNALGELEQLRQDLARANEELSRLASEAAGFDALFEEAATRERQADALVQSTQASVDRLKDQRNFYANALRSVPTAVIGRLDLALPSAGVFDIWLKLACGESVTLTERARKSIDDLPDEEVWLERFGVALRGIADLVEDRVNHTGKNIQVGWGVEIGPCGKTEGFEAYSFTHDGRKYRSDWHAKWGSGTDIRHAFRIYFYWDTDKRVAIVQSVAEHFDNKRTN